MKRKIKRWKQGNNFFNKYLTITNVSFISVIFIVILSNFYTQLNLNVEYRFEDSMIDSIFYVQENIPVSSNIGVNQLDGTEFKMKRSPIVLLYNFNVSYIPTNNNLSYFEFSNFTIMNEIQFIIIKLSFYDDNFYHEFLNASYTLLAGGKSAIDYQLYEN